MSSLFWSETNITKILTAMEFLDVTTLFGVFMKTNKHPTSHDIQAPSKVAYVLKSATASSVQRDSKVCGNEESWAGQGHRSGGEMNCLCYV